MQFTANYFWWLFSRKCWLNSSAFTALVASRLHCFCPQFSLNAPSIPVVKTQCYFYSTIKFLCRCCSRLNNLSMTKRIIIFYSTVLTWSRDRRSSEKRANKFFPAVGILRSCQGQRPNGQNYVHSDKYVYCRPSSLVRIPLLLSSSTHHKWN